MTKNRLLLLAIENVRLQMSRIREIWADLKDTTIYKDRYNNLLIELTELSNLRNASISAGTIDNELSNWEDF